jgi:glycosyltransferase involved in cell wall biosynthesis
MKILLVGNHINDGINSMRLFSDLLSSGLTALGHDVRLVKPKARLAGFRSGGKEFKKWSKYVDQFALFPFELRTVKKWADIVHICDHSNAPHVNHLKGVPCVVTCHDAIGIKRAFGLYQEIKARWTGKILQRWTAQSLRQADRIACVSQTVEREIQETLNIEKTKLCVVYNGLNYPYAPMAEALTKKKLGDLGVPLDRPYILHVGHDSWRKNRMTVIKIFAELRKMHHPFARHLLLVGAPLSGETQKYLEIQGLTNSVQALDHANSEDLCALYSRAALFLFPSLLEGFGWPVIEAQASGCLVATSDRDPMREVSGQGAIHINPEDAIGSARVIASRLETEQDTLRKLGLENVERFSGRHMVKQYARLYESMAGR